MRTWIVPPQAEGQRAPRASPEFAIGASACNCIAPGIHPLPSLHPPNPTSARPEKASDTVRVFASAAERQRHPTCHVALPPDRPCSCCKDAAVVALTTLLPHYASCTLHDPWHPSSPSLRRFRDCTWLLGTGRPLHVRPRDPSSGWPRSLSSPRGASTGTPLTASHDGPVSAVCSTASSMVWPRRKYPSSPVFGRADQSPQPAAATQTLILLHA